ncbi:MAG: hypothetical protein K0R58_4244, partial [Ramlibacter sp.]|nr:hypothetical protein [Ramlibacter sp.]
MNDPTLPPDAPAPAPTPTPAPSAPAPGWEHATMERLLFATIAEQK